jgi:hypothetical protein
MKAVQRMLSAWRRFFFVPGRRFSRTNTVAVPNRHRANARMRLAATIV